MTRLLPWTVLVLGVALLQAHAWYWWTDLITGAPPCFDRLACAAPWAGWGWAVSLEALALWSWPQRGWVRWGVGLACTLVLLTGVLWRVSDPAVRALFQPAVAVESAQAASLQAQIAGKGASVAGYARSGATGSQRAAERELDALHAQLRAQLGRDAAQAAARAASLDWRRWAGIALQGLGVVVLQVGVILAVVRLFGAGRSKLRWEEHRREKPRRPMPWSRDVPPWPDPPPDPAAPREAPPESLRGAALAGWVRAELERRYPGQSWSERAAKLGLNKKAMSCVVNYGRLDGQGAHGLDGYVVKVREALWPPSQTETA